MSLCLRDEEALGSRPMPLSHRVRAVRFYAVRFCRAVRAAELSRTRSRRRRCAAPHRRARHPAQAWGAPPGTGAPPGRTGPCRSITLTRQGACKVSY